MRRNLPSMSLLISVLIFAVPVARGNITYNIVNDLPDQNGYSLSGTIVTDGTMGAISSSDVVSWQYEITGPTGPISTNGTATSAFLLGISVDLDHPPGRR